MKKHFIISFVALISLSAVSQTMEVGLFGGTSYYLGDLNPGKHFLTPKPAYGVLVRYNLNPRLTVRANGYFGRVAGDDLVSNTNLSRNLKFESKVTDLSAVCEFNFFDYFTGSKKNVLTPYIFGGIGLFLFNPTADDVELRSIGTEGQNDGFENRQPYKLVSFSIPFGLGVKYSITSRLGLAAEWGMRKGFTDYLDDVSTTYYLDGTQINPGNQEQVLSDPTLSHKPLMERGNPTTNDWYNFTGVTLTYKFRLFNGNKCPDQQISSKK